jgi:hypothetical protein
MIDRLVHHAEILSLKGDSYRPRDKEIAARPSPALVEPGIAPANPTRRDSPR